MRSPKKPEPKLPSEKKYLADLLKAIEEENEMIDDHGHVIIGARDKKPVIPKEEEE